MATLYFDDTVSVWVNGSGVSGTEVEIYNGYTIFVKNNLGSDYSIFLTHAGVNIDVTSSDVMTLRGGDITITAGGHQVPGLDGVNLLYLAGIRKGYATSYGADVLVHADALYNENGEEIEVATQDDIDNIELEIDGLTDDVADLNDGKLDASKSAVSNVGGLVLPSTTPTSDELVGVGTDNAQKRITLGNGLTLENNVLSASGGGTTKDFNYSISFDIMPYGMTWTGNQYYLTLKTISSEQSINAWVDASPSTRDIATSLSTVTISGYIVSYLNFSTCVTTPYLSGSISSGVFSWYTYNVSTGVISQHSSAFKSVTASRVLVLSNSQERLIVSVKPAT